MPSEPKDNILKPVQPCLVASEQHFWLPTTGTGLQCYSCPMCCQRVYWNSTIEKWTKVTARKDAV